MRMSSGKGVHLVRLDPFFLPLPRLFKPEQPEEHKEEERGVCERLPLFDQNQKGQWVVSLLDRREREKEEERREGQ